MKWPFFILGAPQYKKRHAFPMKPPNVLGGVCSGSRVLARINKQATKNTPRRTPSPLPAGCAHSIVLNHCHGVTIALFSGACQEQLGGPPHARAASPPVATRPLYKTTTGVNPLTPECFSRSGPGARPGIEAVLLCCLPKINSFHAFLLTKISKTCIVKSVIRGALPN